MSSLRGLLWRCPFSESFIANRLSPSDPRSCPPGTRVYIRIIWDQAKHPWYWNLPVISLWWNFPSSCSRFLNIESMKGAGAQVWCNYYDAIIRCCLTHPRCNELDDRRIRVSIWGKFVPSREVDFHAIVRHWNGVLCIMVLSDARVLLMQLENSFNVRTPCENPQHSWAWNLPRR